MSPAAAPTAYRGRTTAPVEVEKPVQVSSLRSRITSFVAVSPYLIVPGDVIRTTVHDGAVCVHRVVDAVDLVVAPRDGAPRRRVDWTLLLDPIQTTTCSGILPMISGDDPVRMDASSLGDLDVHRHLDEGPDDRSIVGGRRHLLDSLIELCGDRPVDALSSLSVREGYPPFGRERALAVLEGRDLVREWMLRRLSEKPDLASNVIPFPSRRRP